MSVKILKYIKQDHSKGPIDYFSCFTNTPELYYCCYCNYKTELSEVLRNHIINHHQNEGNIKEYNLRCWQCEKCPFETFSVLVMTKHVSGACDIIRPIKPLRINQKWYKCDQCPYETKVRRYFSQHKFRKHSKTNQRFKCEHCPGKFFKYKANLKKHMCTTHNDELLFKCEHCPFKTKYKNYLKRHVNNPRGWHECEHCALSFVKKECLRVHLLAEHKEKVRKFKCDKCDCSYTQKQDVNMHMRVKHGDPRDVKWFECEKCPYKSAFGSLYRRHVVRHLNDDQVKWFECEYCQYKSRYKRYINEHVRLKHVNDA